MTEKLGVLILEARRVARLNQGQLALLAGISQSTISRIEAGVVTATFEDVCAIARSTHTPLLFLATGNGHGGLGTTALIAQLHAYGLRDMDTADAPILGESRSFEELIAAAARLASPRIIEAVPGLLLRNKFSTAALRAFARKDDVRHRVGWLSEVAFAIAGTVGFNHLDAREKLERVIRPAWNLRRQRFRLKGALDWDPMNRQLPLRTPADRARTLERWTAEAPAIARKWRIADDTPQERFVERALVILDE